MGGTIADKPGKGRRAPGLLALLRAPEGPAEEPGLEAILNALPEPAAAAAVEGRIIAANGPWRELVGRSGRLPAAPSLYAALAAARRGDAGEGRLTAGGEERTLKVSAIGEKLLLVRLAEPSVRPVEAAPSRTSAEHPAAPATLDVLAAASPFGAALLDGPDPFTAKVVQANPALEAMARGKKLLGHSLAHLIDPKSRKEAAERLAGKPGPVEVKLVGEPVRTAQLYLARSDGQLIAYLVDVSEQKQLELQLMQSQKMQAIGQLAGGVAHDFNNLLQAIQFRLDELLSRHPVGDPSYEGLVEIRQTAVRAADLVKKLLTFSRKQTVQRETRAVRMRTTPADPPWPRMASRALTVRFITAVSSWPLSARTRGRLRPYSVFSLTSSRISRRSSTSNSPITSPRSRVSRWTVCLREKASSLRTRSAARTAVWRISTSPS